MAGSGLSHGGGVVGNPGSINSPDSSASPVRAMSDTGEANRARERGNPGRARALTDRDLPPAGAASVSRRWWEEATSPGSMPLIASAGPETASRAAEVPPPPPPPPPRRSSAKPSHFEQAKTERIKRLEQELAAARDEASALHEMLEDLPEIFERKFRQRLHGILEQQQLLLADNRMLREQLFALQPAPDEPEARSTRLLPPAAVPVPDPSGRSQPLQRVLAGMRRLGRRLRSARPGGRSDNAES